MFTEVTDATKEQFRIIYHQTTEYSFPIIETVLYEDNRGKMYFYGDLLDGNYLIFHRTGFAHINLHSFDENVNATFFQEMDAFIKDNPDIPDYLMFFHTPAKLLAYWKEQPKRHFQVRKRQRYHIDRNHFMKLDPSLSLVPPNHRLLPLHQCPQADLVAFDPALNRKFYDSWEQFTQNSFGFVLYNEDGQPVSMSHLICLVGRNGECDLKTLPDFRNKGYGYVTITHYVRESFLRRINVGWDCFVDNQTNHKSLRPDVNRWIQQYGHTHLVKEYELVTFAK
jgi:GNAT acetyltransferase